jgi:YgiT-type zinc finger domain-containing protein
MGRREAAAARWQAEAQAARADLDQWRQQHPTASFTEIEQAVDAQIDRLRAHLVQDLALASRAAELADRQAGPPPRCPTCRARLVRQGVHSRQVRVRGNQSVILQRDYAVCPACGTGLFPPG